MIIMSGVRETSVSVGEMMTGMTGVKERYLCVWERKDGMSNNWNESSRVCVSVRDER